MSIDTITLREISECDHCGTCCRTHPCFLGSYKELREIEQRHPDARQHIRVESRPAGKFFVRVSEDNKPCRYHVNERCSIHDIKPLSGRQFKCWDLRTFRGEYDWTPNQLRKIGFLVGLIDG